MVVTDKGAETRQRILDVAALAFAEHGYSGISLNEVIRKTGLTKGGLYFHFDSKSELALAVLDHIRDRARAHALATASHHERAVDQIEAIVREIVASKHADPSMAALGRICQELGSAEPELRSRLGHFEGWFTTTEQLFRAAQAEGSMDPSVDVVKAAKPTLESAMNCLQNHAAVTDNALVWHSMQMQGWSAKMTLWISSPKE